MESGAQHLRSLSIIFDGQLWWMEIYTANELLAESVLLFTGESTVDRSRRVSWMTAISEPHAQAYCRVWKGTALGR